jgi:KipI family sensor histidine kinase inhibitor
MTVYPLGDSAVVVVLGDNVDANVAARVRAAVSEIEHHPLAGVVDVVPAFASVAVFFDPRQAPTFDVMRVELEARVARSDAAVVGQEARVVEIPVCYGGEDGPDLEAVAERARLPVAEVVTLHAAADYLVHAIGFVPGFPYLGGLPAALQTPRRATPRAKVPAGSVGIGGAQTGIYSMETPGGWNIIGRTPLTLFDARRDPPALLQAGDRVRFQVITAEEFATRSAAERAKWEERNFTNTSGRKTSAMEATDSRDDATTIELLRAGMFTTVQDLGRRGQRALGVPLSGAADEFAARVANMLVGNPDDAAVLEFTLIGPELRFHHDTIVAVGGGQLAEVPGWRPLTVRAGTILRLGPLRSGCRGYLAVAGGIDVALVLGSRSTYTRALLGGHEGRPLRDGDRLPTQLTRRQFRNHWWIDERVLPAYSSEPTVRVVRGAQADEFDDAWMRERFAVTTRADRMGVRLKGIELRRSVQRELVSSPVAPGTVQVPPDGQPIVLLADAQTIGGYPQIGHVIAVDLPLVAQLRPGDGIRFQQVTLEEARRLIVVQERAIALLREGLAQKLA